MCLYFGTTNLWRLSSHSPTIQLCFPSWVRIHDQTNNNWICHLVEKWQLKINFKITTLFTIKKDYFVFSWNLFILHLAKKFILVPSVAVPLFVVIERINGEAAFVMTQKIIFRYSKRKKTLFYPSNISLFWYISLSLTLFLSVSCQEMVNFPLGTSSTISYISFSVTHSSFFLQFRLNLM